jgi:hypothetical protein
MVNRRLPVTRLVGLLRQISLISNSNKSSACEHGEITQETFQNVTSALWEAVLLFVQELRICTHKKLLDMYISVIHEQIAERLPIRPLHRLRLVFPVLHVISLGTRVNSV